MSNICFLAKYSQIHDFIQCWDELTRLFPRASATDLETSYSNTGRLQVKRSGFGKKSYPLFTKDKQTGKERLNPQLTKEIKDSLGSSAGDVIVEDRDTIGDQRQRLTNAEEQLRQAEALDAERKKHAQEMQTLGQQIEITQARIDALQGEHGSNLESEVELNRLKQVEKNYKSDLEKKKKELTALEKQLKKKMNRSQQKEKNMNKRFELWPRQLKKLRSVLRPVKKNMATNL